jgi:hypothetical protein
VRENAITLGTTNENHKNEIRSENKTSKNAVPKLIDGNKSLRKKK